mmetsp:Transcript_20805/g.32096  ORF Transcript_20805/g.32096 Transcript_20805/m.32096 type:complete len:98 (+) Transcript_20805:3014-3307(+)
MVYAQQLAWSDYFSLLKKLTFKLHKARNQANSVSAHGDPELQKERLVVKAICRVLDGFNFPGIPDAIETLLKTQAKKEKDPKPNQAWGTDLTEVIQA